MKILFVCSGNTCRSPMAQFIMQDLIDKKGLKNFHISSAGIVGPAGISITKEAVVALRKMGIRAGNKKSNLIDEFRLGDFDYIITMTNFQKQKIGLKNCFSVFDFCGFEVEDPFMLPQKVYFAASKQIKIACEKILEKIKDDERWFV